MNVARTLTAWAASMVVSSAGAQSNWSTVPVPVYDPSDFARGLYQHGAAPRAAELHQQAGALARSVRALCNAPGPANDAMAAARAQWWQAVTAWERLSAVAVGPVIERRSGRQIDFTPTRPALIDKAIAAAPSGPRAMERVGTPAKGFPALEWLLWVRPAAPATPACGYAVEVAADIERETQALTAGFDAAAGRAGAGAAVDEAAAVSAMNEAINQWVGAIERLRWAQMEKPLKSGRPGDWPRAASGHTAASWAAHWQAVKGLTVFEGDRAPAPGSGLVPIETYLRGRGLNPLADRLVQAARRVDARIDTLAAQRQPQAAAVSAAAMALGDLKRLAESEVAPALDVRIGFSDADGD